jgi:hypothetical protein
MSRGKLVNPSNNSAIQSCPGDKYWVRSHQRIRKDKNGKTHIEQVRGYCSSYRAPYHKIALEENISLDHLYYALTVYGEARSENAASKRAIAWIIRNRLRKKRWGTSYQKVVVRPVQFKCWNKKDPNYAILQHPGRNGLLSDKNAWEECKKIIEEVHNASEKDNPIPGICNYFSGKADPKVSWEKNPFDLPGVTRFHFVKLD